MEAEQKKSFLTIAVIAVASLSILALLDQLLAEKINDNRIAYELREVNAVKPVSDEKEISEDKIIFSGENKLTDKESLMVFRQWQTDQPIGLVLAPVSAKGYNDKIKLCIGINHKGDISGVRILSHNETQNLGDQIHQSKSDWLQQFIGQSLGGKENKDWQLKQDGGSFDGISGASITSRAVVNVIHDTLKFYDNEKKSIYSK